MSSKKVLLHFDAERAEHEISALKEKRDGIAHKLAVFRAGLATLMGRDPLAHEVEAFLSYEYAETVKLKAFEAYLKARGIDLPLDASKVVDGINDIEIDSLVDAWLNAHGASEDPMRYWSDTKQDFRLMPVTKEERAEIEERNRTYAADEKAASIQRYVETTVELINYSNKHHNVGMNPVRLKQTAPWLIPFVRTKKRIRYRNDGSHFEAVGTIVTRHSYRAFDE